MAKLIKTIDGRDMPAEKCAKIKGNYYVVISDTVYSQKEGECVNIRSKHYRTLSTLIFYDFRERRWHLLSECTNLIEGVIGVDKNQDLLIGKFSKPSGVDTSDFPMVHYKGALIVAVSDAIFYDTVWEEDIQTGQYHNSTKTDTKNFSSILEVSESYKRSRDYNATEYISSATSKFNKLYARPPITSSNHLEKLAKEYTFGLEFETTKGTVPKRICNELGLIPLRDGSIGGMEYVTIPHSGAKGMNAVYQSVIELDKRTEYNRDCSLHLHVGNVPRTVSFITAFTRMICKVQEEVYPNFPFYTRGGYGLKRKDYTAPLPVSVLLDSFDKSINNTNITANFSNIFKYLSSGVPFSEYDNNLSNVHSHPSDPNGNRKWNVRARYKWVNMIPLIFGNKKTIEFRIQRPTTDPDEVMHFMLFCFSLVDFAKSNQTAILNGSIEYNLSSILNSYTHDIPKTEGIKDFAYLNELYWRHRRDRLASDFRNGDMYSVNTKFSRSFKFNSGGDFLKKVASIDLTDLIRGDIQHRATLSTNIRTGLRGRGSIS